jgi:hypothetical protein
MKPVTTSFLCQRCEQAKAAWAGVAMMDSNRWVNRTACNLPLPVVMRKAILMTLLAVVSSSAVAEWVAVGGNDLSSTYVDPATILKVGDKVKMWHLVDFNAVQVKPTGKRYLSEKLQYEYDCTEERARMLSFLSHSGNMGGGVMVEGDWHPRKWEPIPPDSVVDYLRKFACGKR